MTAPPDVVDVHPPDHLPPVRRPGRVKSLLLVLASIVLTASMGLVVAAPPAAALVQLLAPLVPHGLRIAPSAVKLVTGKTFMTPTVGVLGGGLALGAGGMYGDAGDGDWDDEAIWRKLGIKMPWDAKVDAATPESPANHRPPGVSHHNFQITRYEWMDLEWNGTIYKSLRIEAGCTRVDFSIGSSNCPVSMRDGATGSTFVTSVKAEAQCLNPDTGNFYTNTSAVRFNGRQIVNTTTGQPFCMQHIPGPGWRQNPIASFETFNDADFSPAFGRLVNPEKVINPDFDPTPIQGVTITATVQCQQPGTDTTVSVSNVSESADAIPVVNCPPGWTPTSLRITSDLPGGVTKDLGGVNYDWSQFPACADMSCVLRVTMDGVPCRVDIDDCYDWMRVEPKSRVACEYGPYALGLEQCRDLEHLYRSTPGVTPNHGAPNQPQPRPAPDGTPNPNTPTRLVPSSPDGQPIPDLIPQGPKLPDPYPPAQTNPTPTPTVNPDPPGTPGPTTVPIPPPVNVPNPPGNPKDPDNPTKNCMGGMASWNPVDWIYTPVKCALTWAFVPPNGTGPSLIGDFRAKVLTAELGAWLAIPDDLFGSLPQGSGCMGPPLNMPEPLGGKTYYPLNACSDPMAKYANMSRSLITIVVVFYGMFSIVNSLTVAMTGYRMFDRETASLAKQVG